MSSHRTRHRKEGKLPEGYLPEDRLSGLLEDRKEDSRIQLYTPPGELVKISNGDDPNEEPDEETTFTFTFHNDGRIHPNFREPLNWAGPNFLDWLRFEEAVLPPRENVRSRSASDIWKPLNKFKADLPGGVHIEGLDGLAESVHNLFNSAKQLYFMEKHRAIRIPHKTFPHPLPELPRRELERLENELFDVSKYNGACEHLTALAWSEDGRTGSITLYEVNLDDRYRRQRDVPMNVRPVAAMTGVPKSVLVEMRKHEKIRRKIVFVPSDEEARGFKWKANPSRGPTYVKLPEKTTSCEVDLYRGPPSPLYPPRSPMRRSSADESGSRSRSQHSSSSNLVDADGVRATIPQFVALLHASRAILEDIESTSVDPVETEDGKVLPTVHLKSMPRENRHEGAGVHVTVLIPSDSDWTDDQIVWTDKYGLVEFRRRKYWDLIEWETRTPDARRRHSSHSHSGHSSADRSRRSDRSLSPHRISSHHSNSHSRRGSRLLDLPPL
ncbi:hypothetical protein QBC37DRAFT_58706 [Rhypophila decipiens]|uniref:Uncharacterized protein n=1 Tax=Rhypophila decipiens TaxID=261697 RepID=A0AAN6XY74_9PEZI|nr:hypothetical protein QBC37DRAFT_58706 [Rhypophila decipiens]